MPSLGALVARVPEPVKRILRDALYPDLLAEGETAPEWHLQSWDGTWHRQGNRWTLLVFYPGDDTPGCTLQLLDVQKNQAALTRLGVDVYGVNPAEAPSHQAFAEKCGFTFPILVDRGASVARQFRSTLAIPLKPRVIRTVYLVNPDRKIRLANRGAPSIAAIIRSVEALQQATRDGR